MTLTVRDARLGDVAELVGLLNEIVAIGGTTAREEPITEAGFRAEYLACPGFVSCVVAEGADGVLYGFQGLERHHSMPPDWAAIGSFARQTPRMPGVGQAMFPETCARARADGVATIQAVIRADNVPGLAYYAKMGFQDYDVRRAVPLADGTPVDRVCKRYDLG